MASRRTSEGNLIRRETLKNINKVVLGPGVSLEGDELEDYCKKRGLCPLCAKSRTRKRVFKLFKKNKWEPLTVQNSEGKYLVYKGYCTKPNCFSFEQAKRLAGEGPKRQRPSRTRSVMKGFAENSNDDDTDSQGKTTHKRNPAAFPPSELKNTTNFQILDDQPLFVIQKTVEALRTDSAVQILDLSGLELRHIDLEALVDGLKVNTTLTSLVLENCKLDDAKLSILAGGLHEAKDIPLTKLYLRTQQISDAGVDALCPFLEANVTLEKLDLSRNGITTRGAVAIFNAFHRNRLTRIRCINFSHNQLWDLNDDQVGVRSFVSRNRSLRVLNLEGNYIHDEGVQAMAQGLEENDQTALERLYLGWNSIGDEGAIALSEMLEVNTSLRILGLGENQIQNAGARSLLTAMDVNLTVREISGLWRNQIDRRFIIVAIRRLLLSADRGEGPNFAPGEQAPMNGSGTAPVRTSSSIESNVSSMSMDADYADSGNHFKSISEDEALAEIEMDLEHQKTKPMFTSKLVAAEAPRNGMKKLLEPLVESSGPPFDRLTVFQSAPLAYFDRESGVHKGIPLLDFKFEKSAIEESVSGALGAEIEVVVETATIDRFSAFLAEQSSHVMHFSCFGHPDHLTLENGYGSLQTLPVDGLRRLTTAVGSNLRVVFISSCHARKIGDAFVEAGIPHVVCCQRDRRFRDLIASEFAQNFYRALSHNKLLGQAFDSAMNAMSASPFSKSMRMLTDRFQLLPERRDHYHNVPVFFTHQVAPRPEPAERLSVPQLPRIPDHFIGREVDMYEILEALRVDDIVRIAGPPGNGKDSVISAVCDYAMERRKMFSVDDIYWLPAPEGVIPEEDSLYGDLCLCVNILRSSKTDIWDTDDTLLECRDRIEIEMEELQVVLVLDDRGFAFKGAQEGLEKFISHLLNVANAKVILITTRSSDTVSAISISTAGSRIEEANIDIAPLDFKSTAQLFGGISKYIQSSGCPAAHSASEFAELLEPAFISKMPDPSVVVSQRRSDLYTRLGGGMPSAVISAARNMPKKDFIELIGIANRPEVFVDCLGALEKEIRRRSMQKGKAVEEKNFMRAMDLDIILEELEGMRPEFPTLEDLREEEDLMKEDLADAVASRRYDSANDLKRELLGLKKKIMKEQRLLPDQAQEANERLNEFQAQVQSMIDDANFSNGGGKNQSATFAVHCGERDCSFVIYSGEVYDFEHPSEAMGVVCWSNESCVLEGSPLGEKLLEYGGSELKQDISTLPVVVSSEYGPIRCGTGNAVIIGPEKYGKLDAPCVVLTVGPLSPTNLEDALEDDTDSLHYIKIMLRSCYRSSLVLAKHAELQALALSLLTTRKTGKAYEQTLRVGLQTLVEEVKFSHLRDLHIVASSTKEAQIIIAMMSDMGHQQI